MVINARGKCPRALLNTKPRAKVRTRTGSARLYWRWRGDEGLVLA